MPEKLCIGCKAKHIPVGRKQRCDTCDREYERSRRRRRGTRVARGYGKEWYRLAARALRQQPFCSACGTSGDLTVDHKDPATRGRTDLGLSDVQVLCRSCNSRKSDHPTGGSRGGRAARPDASDDVLIA